MAKDLDCESHVQTPLLAVFDVLVCFLVVGSYIPQIAKVAAACNTAGISAWYIIFLSISSTTQLAARMVNAFSQLAFECVRGGHLRGWKAFSALVIYLQAIVQWICAVLLLVAYVKFRSYEDGNLAKPILVSRHEGNSDPDHEAYTPQGPSVTSDTLQPASMTNTTVLATVVTYVIVILPVAFAFLIRGPPDDYKDGYGSEITYFIFQQLFDIILALSGLVTALSSAVPEIRLIVARFRAGEGLGSLSLFSLGLQFLAFVGLGVSQGLRLGWPHIGDRSQPPLSVWAWFLGVNGPAVGFVALGVSQLLVLCAAFAFGRAGGQIRL